MGVTIHYSGGLEAASQLAAALTMLRTECEQRGWPYRAHDFEARGTFETYVVRAEPTDLPGVTEMITDIAYIELDTRWRGLIVRPHPDSEALTLMFDAHTGRLMMLMEIDDSRSVSYDLSIKTQFAPLDTHVAVCEVLRRLQQGFGATTLHVRDESGYYDTGDRAALRAMRSVIESALDDLDILTTLTRWATTGEQLPPPNADELSQRLN